MSGGTGIPFGAYRLVKRVARGGMAEVFLARQRGLEGFDRVVALKRILPHLVDSEDFVRMFLHEARLAARLSHANIVHIYDFGKVDEQYFIAMEYVDGCHAGALIHRAPDHPLPPALVARIGADACAGLHYAHQLKNSAGKPLRIVHRDISPPNLLVSLDGVVKLVDFGIAKAVTAVDFTRPGVVKGKFAYMSPEQAGGDPLDGRSDVFALGLVLFELLSGRPAVDRERPMEAMRRIRRGDVPRIEDACPDVPPALAEAIGRALAVDREQRATALDLGNVLEAFIKQSPELGTSLQLAAWIRDNGPAREPLGRLLATSAGLPAQGTSEGTSVGTSAGTPEGTSVGTSAGTPEGTSVGTSVGTYDGTATSTDHTYHGPPDGMPHRATIDGMAPMAEQARAGEIATHAALDAPDDRHDEPDDEDPLKTTEDRLPPAHPLPDPPARTPLPFPPPPTHRRDDTIPMQLGTDGHEVPYTDRTRIVAAPRRPPWRLIAAVFAVAAAGVLGAAIAGALIEARSGRAAEAATTTDAEPAQELARGGSDPADATPPSDAAEPVTEPLAPAPPDAGPPPADAAPEPASLTVITDPEGAEVVVAGQGQPLASPAYFVDIPPGTHQIELSRDGYQGRERTVTLEPGENRTLELSLRRVRDDPPRPTPQKTRRAERARGRLVIRTQPYSNVYLGRRKLGTTPFADVTLPPGTYTLTFRNPDHRPHRRQVRVRSGEETRLDFRLP